MSTLPPIQSSHPVPPPDLHLQLISDSDSEDEELSGMGAGARRPSTASLSRFRSCPHLASAVNASQDSPQCDMAPMTDQEGNIIHTSPAVYNNLRVERPSRMELTSTPTPPSTPGSKRKDVMTSSAASMPHHSNSNGASPASTPKLSRRARQDANLIPRTFSSDSQGAEGGAGGSLPLKENSSYRFDDLCLRDGSNRYSFYNETPDFSADGERASETDDASSMHICGHRSENRLQEHHSPNFPPSQNQYQPGSADDSVDKCHRWLQGLKLTKADKMKSRSHIQLPPV